MLAKKYRLDRVLGMGGMATVYAATHLRNANRVAVKILNPELAIDAGLRARFLREGYAANSVEHPGTVRVLDDDTATDGAVFLVMDLLDGETLDARWQRKGRRLATSEVAEFMHQVLDVLGAAHAKGIVHRDIKPENLFLTRDRSLKVLDFGVARLLERSVTATRSGGVIGTPAFMAPEQVLGKTREVDAQSDLWSVGATAFTLLSGRYVHEAETVEEMMVFAATRHPPRLATVLPGLPVHLTEVIDRALNLDKTERWRTARAMQRAVAGAYRLDFGAPVPGAKVDEEDEEDDKTTLMKRAEPPAPIVGDTLPMDGAGSPPVAPTQVAESLPVRTVHARPSTIAGVTATRPGRPSPLNWVRSSGGVGRKMAPWIGVAAVALLGTGSIIAIIAKGQRPEPFVRASPVLVDARAAPAASGIAEVKTAPTATQPAAIEAPAIAIESLPIAPRPAATPPRAKTIANTPPAPTPAHVAAPAAKPDCSLPFVIDASGNKKWKAECL